MLADDVIVRREQEAARAAGRIADRLARLGAHHLHHRGDERARREVLARAAFHVLGVLLQQALRKRRPSRRRTSDDHCSLSIRSTISRRSLAGSWILFCALRKMTPSMPGRFAEFLQRVAVMNFQLVAIELAASSAQSKPFGNGRRLVERRPALLVRHFEEQQKRQLLDVVAVGQAVIPQDVAVVPELLDELMRTGLP